MAVVGELGQLQVPNGDEYDLIDEIIRSSICNPNLIDNPWFTVNQRGISSWTLGQYGVDRWIIFGDASTAVAVNSDNSLAITMGEYLQGVQYMEEDVVRSLLGKKVTLSIKYDNDQIKSETFTMPSTLDLTVAQTIFGQFTIKDSFVMAFDAYNGKIRCTFINQTAGDTGKTLKIIAIKLEIGEISTLVNECKPNYEQELAKCQRYFIAGPMEGIYLSGIYNSTNCKSIIPLPVTMKQIPSIVGEIKLRDITNDYFISGAPTASVERISNNAITFIITGLTSEQARVCFTTNASGLSCEPI